jgi:hypothetical protein
MSNFSSIYRGRVISIRRRKFFNTRRRTRLCRRFLLAAMACLLVSVVLRDWVAVAACVCACVACVLGAIR